MKKSTQESKDQLKVLKYKIAISDVHMYSCGFIIINCNLNSILRMCFVMSYNPSVYEIDIKQELKKIEHLIYQYKFGEGSCVEDMRKFYTRLCELSDKLIDSINNNALEDIKEVLLKIFNNTNDKIKIEYIVEPIKHDTFVSDLNIQENIVNKFENGKFFIKMKPVIDNKKGVNIDKIKPNKHILCELIDNREIVQNIVNILFAKNQKYFYTNVVKIIENKKYYELICTITPVIFTKILVNKGQRVIVRK